MPADRPRGEAATVSIRRVARRTGRPITGFAARCSTCLGRRKPISPDCHPLLLWLEDQPIGAIQVDDLRNAAAALRLVAIDPALQGGGHGRAMLERAEQFVRDLGCRKAVVYATPEAAGFYQPCRLRRGRLGRGLHGRHRADAEETGLTDTQCRR